MSSGASKRSLSDLRDLLEHQAEIKDWLQLADQRIYELEESYLESTPLGNIIRGWEIDGKPMPSRPRTVDEKERLFSNSSYHVYLENKSAAEGKPAPGKSEGNPKKKSKRSSTAKKDGIYEDWEGDY
jgi:hypothetical protein